MAIEYGPKLGLVVHAIQNENWYDDLTKLLRAIDALVQCNVISHLLTTPPGSPSDGAVYIVAEGATGDWASHDSEIARWSEKISAWEFYVPAPGWVVYSNEDGETYRFKDGEWLIFSGGGGEPVEPVGGPGWDQAFSGGELGDVDPGDQAEVSQTTYEGSPARAVGFPQSSGKKYLEFSFFVSAGVDGMDLTVGLGNQDFVEGSVDGPTWSGYWNLSAVGSAIRFDNTGVLSATGGGGESTDPFTEASRVGIAVDIDAGVVWVAIDNVWQNGDPAAGTDGTAMSVSGVPIFPWAGLTEANSTIRIRPGATTQMYSSPAGFDPWYVAP